MFAYKSFKKYGDQFTPSGRKDYKKAVKKGKDVVGKSGDSKAPKGYYQSGTTTRESAGGSFNPKTFAIYSKLPGQKKSEKKRKDSNERERTSQQSDFSDQLRIIREENARRMDEYRKIMEEEEERRMLAAEEQKMAIQAARTNRMREGSAASLQIQPADGTRRSGGTQQFRRRPLQFGGVAPYGGLSQISSGMVNI